MTAGQVSDYKGAAALLGGLPPAEWLLADRSHKGCHTPNPVGGTSEAEGSPPSLAPRDHCTVKIDRRDRANPENKVTAVREAGKWRGKGTEHFDDQLLREQRDQSEPASLWIRGRNDDCTGQASFWLDASGAPLGYAWGGARQNPFTCKTKSEVPEVVRQNGAGDQIKETVSCTSLHIQSAKVTHRSACTQCLYRRLSIYG